MTLDEAQDAYRAKPESDDAAADYVTTAAEYFRDGMIEPGTFVAMLEEITRAMT